MHIYMDWYVYVVRRRGVLLVQEPKNVAPQECRSNHHHPRPGDQSEKVELINIQQYPYRGCHQKNTYTQLLPPPQHHISRYIAVISISHHHTCDNQHDMG